MLDLGNLPTTATGKLTRAFPKKDPDGGMGSIIWDIDISFDVNSLSEAKLLDKIVSGASSVYEAGQLGGKAEAKDQSEYEVLRCVLFCKTSNKKICSGHSEILQSTIKVNGPKSIFILKLRIYGLITEQAVHIINRIEEPIHIYLGAVDQNKISSIEEAEIIVSKKYRGSIAISENEEAFHVLEKQGGLYLVEDSNGECTRLEADEVVNILRIKNSSEMDYIGHFVKICSEVKLQPDYMYIVKALVSEFTIGNISASEGEWMLSVDILRKALKLLSEDQAGKHEE